MLWFLFKNTEYRFSVMPGLEKPGVGFEIMVGVVFEYQPPVGMEELLCKNFIGYFVQFRQSVGWTSKDIVVFFATGRYKFEDIRPNDLQFGGEAELNGGFFYKIDAGGKFVHIGYIRTTSGNELITVVAGTAKKVENFEVFKIEGVVQNIKKAFFGKIGGRPGRPMVRRRVETPSFKLAADNTHQVN